MIVPIRSTRSLVHLGSLDSFDITTGGKEAARLMLDALRSGAEMPLRRAIDIYEEIIPHENFGGEYTALQWLCRLLLAPDDARRGFLEHPDVASWFELLSRDGYARLRWYLERKYHFVPMEPGDAQARHELRFLEDFMLFGNPDRERWEHSAEGFRALDVQPGETIADVGAGAGYYSFRFAERVGREGRVYAVETNPLHLEYLRAYVAAQGLTQVTIVAGAPDGIGLPEDVRVDLVFLCSLYHVLYAALTLEQRDSTLAAIQRALRPGGRLVIVDNDLVEEDGELPYHGPYIARDLVAAQLAAYGFEMANSWRFTPQRYAMVFRWTGEEVPVIPPAAHLPPLLNPHGIDIRDRASLVCYRMAEAAPTAGYSAAGREAAARFLAALDGSNFDALNEDGHAAPRELNRTSLQKPSLYEANGGGLTPSKAVQRSTTDGVARHAPHIEGPSPRGDIDRAALRLSLAEYQSLAARERIGDEYTAFAWACRLLLADDAQREHMLADDLARLYVETLGGEDLPILRTYLRAKYELPHAQSPSDLTGISEYIAFNNPARDDWEHTERMLDDLRLAKGMRIADIGCGSGYFTYRFARAVGARGRVYATETNPQALRYVEDMRDRLRLPIETIVGSLDDARLPRRSIDLAFMCSMYHAVYIASIEFVKDAFIESLRRAMAPGGRLVVVDNDVPRPGIPSYYGSSIDRRLIIAQLTAYGFRLVAQRQYIPQRYILEFA